MARLRDKESLEEDSQLRNTSGSTGLITCFEKHKAKAHLKVNSDLHPYHPVFGLLHYDIHGAAFEDSLEATAGTE